MDDIIMMENMHWDWGLFWPSILIILILWTIVVFLVYQDAERANMNGMLWAVVVAVTMIIGLLVYVVLRVSDSDRHQSKQASSSFSTTYMYCSNCGAKNIPDSQFCSACAALM